MSRVMAFDIEIVKEIPDGQDWKSVRPLGISCAATVFSDTRKPYLWYAGHDNISNDPTDKAMSIEEVDRLIRYLCTAKEEGYEVITWNGLSFDFDVLAEEGTLLNECKELALDHIDMMFQIVCTKGFPLGLNTVAKGLGLAGKTEGMHGDLAPKMWANSVEDRKKVLEYVGQDVITTLEVYEEVAKRKSISWTSKSGRLQYMPISEWLTVAECMKLPLPDTSWMTNPMERKSYYEWTTK